MMAECLIIPLLLGAVSGAAVTATETVMTLPTYATKGPDRIPIFYRPEEVQLAEKHVYPYPFYDVQSEEKRDQDYVAVILENEYLKICVTPQMGGRLYYALDKTNNYELVYHNRVVKPALIGMIGAWTSGGIEWNTPHHHRATSLIDVDYALVEHEDGSKTVWVGEYEKRSQTRWLTGLTLEPGKAYVKIECKSVNVTPFQYPALYFANAAVHVSDAYQFVFPPDVEMVNFHYVTEFARWPRPNQVYQSVDYTGGEDLSWWKAAKQPTSFFVTHTRQDFMGGIDHDKQAGTFLLGDHRIFKGKKVWNWGKNEVQEAWDVKLTDADGPYAELMMGLYSDNQPDYNFVAPFETKYGTMHLFGVKEMSGVKEANTQCVLNLELQDSQALVQINALLELPNARVVLEDRGRILLDESLLLSPLHPYQGAAAIDSDAQLEDLRLSVRSADGAELIAWQQQPPRNDPFPAPYEDPKDPREYDSSQDLFLAGLKLEQLGNTNFDYMKYYEAALRINPGDVMTNTRIGQVYLKRRQYDKAEEHLARAAAAVTANHTKAEYGAPLYYLGVCRMGQDRLDEALDLLYRATWAYAWTSAGYTLAAALEGRQGNWGRALDAAERACAANSLNVEALIAKAMVQRRLGMRDEARATARQVLAADPLCFAAMNEERLLSEETGNDASAAEALAALTRRLRAEPYNYIETAARYAAFGLYDEAAAVMGLAATAADPALRDYPMTHYHLGMYLALAGKTAEAEQALHGAAGLSSELCFPYGDESIRALRFALAENPEDALAWRLLGNALADSLREEAVRCWAEAAQRVPNDSILYRNMAYLQANHLDNMPDALENIMKAVALNPEEPRYFAEADLYMSYASLSPEQWSEFLAEYGAMGKDIVDIGLMQIRLDIFNGNCDRAISLLEGLRYHIKEGAEFNPHVYWFDAHVQQGIVRMQRGEHAEAEQSFLRAMEFPANLEAERNGKVGIAYYYLGLNSKADGRAEQAADYFSKMLHYTYSQGWGAGDFPEIAYFKAMAAIELGTDRAEVDAMFQQLIADGEKRLTPVKDSRHITVAVDESHGGRSFLIERELARKGLRVSSYYMQGLGFLGLGDSDKARSFFEKALAVEPLAVDPKRMLESIR